MSRRLNQKGLTLLELAIVAVAVGIISMLAIPQFGKVMERLKLKTAGRDIVSSLRLARSSAVSQKDQFGVYFDYNSNQYVLFHDVANPSSFTYDLGSDSVIVTKDLPGNVNLGYISFPNLTVVFKPNGSASYSGNVGIYCYGEYSGYLAVDVLGSTGRVKLIPRD
ncbi:MAG: GspH/FimT family pseudopilin [candidate division Zixibacteria bacterium]|nr:GspH/FimT family pseudopilin [candidate division Zixibacteria bacterium]